MPTRREFIEGSGALAAFAATPALAQNQQGVRSTARTMKIIGLEEHVVLPEIQQAWARTPGVKQGPSIGSGNDPISRRLRDFGEMRIRDMADQGVDMQVLALASPGVQNLSPADAVAVSRAVNDRLASIVRGRPDKFHAFAAIPTPQPSAAAAELERAVTKLGLCGAMLYGRTGDVKPESRVFDDLYATASRLRVPLYFHPQTIPAGISQAMYGGMPENFGERIAGAGLGWYYDLGLQMLRMIYTGVFDRHPKLQVIIGHWGEVVLFYLDHTGFFKSGPKNERPLIDYFRKNFWITGSGTQSDRYMRWTAEVVGTERMMYSTDYPYTFDTGDQFVETSRGLGRSFLDRSSFTPAQKVAIASGNWQQLIAPVTDAFK